MSDDDRKWTGVQTHMLAHTSQPKKKDEKKPTVVGPSASNPVKPPVVAQQHFVADA